MATRNGPPNTAGSNDASSNGTGSGSAERPVTELRLARLLRSGAPAAAGAPGGAAVSAEQARQARARVAAALAVGAAVLVVLAAAVWWVGSVTRTTPGQPPAPAAAGPGVTVPGASSGRWDVAAQARLAAAPMPTFPDAAAFPQTLSTRSMRPAIVLPPPGLAPAAAPGGLVAGGFPPSPAGAIAQLAALNRVALEDLNPQTYAAAYRSISLPGAPNPAATPLGREVATVYATAVTGASDPSPISSRWQPAGGLIKGSTDGGRFVVACVSGELQAVKARSSSSGAADCQGMRWTGTRWAISPGPAPAAPPAVWPGSDEFTLAGFHPLSGATS